MKLSEMAEVMDRRTPVLINGVVYLMSGAARKYGDCNVKSARLYKYRNTVFLRIEMGA